MTAVSQYAVICIALLWEGKITQKQISQSISLNISVYSKQSFQLNSWKTFDNISLFMKRGAVITKRLFHSKMSFCNVLRKDE
jgi:hypothetical protein